MYELKVIGQFSSAHRLRNYKGKCENLHGHNWKVEVSIASEMLDKTGLVIDFSDIKMHLAHVLKPLDHAFLNDIAYFKKNNPTSEHIARYVFEHMKKRVQKNHLRIAKVTIWESDTACATYYE